MTKELTLIVTAALALLALPATSAAHPTHGSCRPFGQSTSLYARTLPPGEYGAFVAGAESVGEDIAYLHGVECEPR